MFGRKASEPATVGKAPLGLAGQGRRRMGRRPATDVVQAVAVRVLLQPFEAGEQFMRHAAHREPGGEIRVQRYGLVA